MNRKQKIITLIFAILILTVSFVSLSNDSFLAGIIGISISAGLFIYCFSGEQNARVGRISFKSIFKNKVVKIILITIVFLVITLVSIGLMSSTRYKRENRVKEQRQSEARLRNSQYLQDNVEIISSRIDLEEEGWTRKAYLFITIKNKGDRDVFKLTMLLNYYDNEKYLIEKGTVDITKMIPAGVDKKFKIGLDYNNYPYSQIGKIDGFEIKPISCKTLKIIKGGLK